MENESFVLYLQCIVVVYIGLKTSGVKKKYGSGTGSKTRVLKLASSQKHF